MGKDDLQTLTPGAFVVHPERPDWGLGQVQSVVGRRVTVNFENAGKLLIDSGVVGLQPAEPDRSTAKDSAAED
jgi:hypothetical protein